MATYQKKKNVTNWRAAEHGSLQFDKEKMQMREGDQEAHLPVFVDPWKTHAMERSACGEAARQSIKKRPEQGRRRRRYKQVRPEFRRVNVVSSTQEARGALVHFWSVR